MNSKSTSRIALQVPRHLQDFNGYCGPACAMMVVGGEAVSLSPELHAQHLLFREIRQHAKSGNDRRAIKSPAESLLAVLEKHSRTRWRKAFDPSPGPIARLILDAIETLGQPAVLLVSKGMHWVVAFGRTCKDDGSVAGFLLRDPAWAGMPAFFGLSIFPQKGTFIHGPDPCECLYSDHPPACVHERYMAYDEILSTRGLHGSPDWEGSGAIALIPVSPARDSHAH